jgi:hypothetical protein
MSLDISALEKKIAEYIAELRSVPFRAQRSSFVAARLEKILKEVRNK